MIQSVIRWSCLVFIFGYLIKYLDDGGVFRHVKPHGFEECRVLIPPGGEDLSFEDLAPDYEKGVVYAAGDRRGWWGSFDVASDAFEHSGDVFVLEIAKEKFEKIHLSEYPYAHFHPLGIGLLKGKTDHLFSTNYRSEGGKLVPTVEIFQVDSTNSNQLKWIDSVVHPLFTAPDDVLAIDERTFYMTNVFYYRKDHSKFKHTMEILTRRPWTNLILCKKTDHWDCSIIMDSLSMANGLAASSDFQTIYLAVSITKQIFVFHRNPTDHSLTLLRKHDVPILIDNIIVNEKDQLIAAGHMNALRFLLHEKNSRKYRAPSEVLLFPDPKTNSTFESLLVIDGEPMSALTVGMTYKNKRLFGALFDAGILIC